MSDLISYQNNVDVKNLQGEILRVLEFSEKRVITTQEDLSPATDDLAMMGKLKNAIEELRTSYVKPLNDEVKAINYFFKNLSEPLAKANTVTRDKVKVFMIADTRPEIPQPKIKAQVGTASTRMVAKYKITDADKVPGEFWIINEKSLAAQIKAGRRNIDGVKIWEEPEITVRSQK